jgi:hypothetical protein
MSEVRSFVTEFLFDESLLTHASISQVSFRPQPVIYASGLQTFILPRTPSSQARLCPGVESLVHLSYPLSPRALEAETSHPNVFSLAALPHLICVTLINTATPRFTIIPGVTLRLSGPDGWPHRYHSCPPWKCFLPLQVRTHHLAITMTRSFRVPLSHQLE